MRLDKAIVAAGLAESRARAQLLIDEGVVTVGGRVVRKASQMVAPGEVALLHNPIPWVSRAALKLVAGLDHFGLSPEGLVALDLGASTGGFTEVLLARGARRVFAVDVGHGQLHPSVRDRAEVVNLEGVNAKALPEDVGEVDCLVSDLSFISLRKALEGPLARLRPDGWMVLLVKPQFEVGRAGVGKNGIVTDEALRQQACADVAAYLEGAGARVLGLIPSPILGSDGNVEFLIAATHKK